MNLFEDITEAIRRSTRDKAGTPCAWEEHVKAANPESRYDLERIIQEESRPLRDAPAV